MSESNQSNNKLPELNISSKANYIKIKSILDFFLLFKKIEKDCKNCFLFESLEVGGQTSRYDVVGFEPEILFWTDNNKLVWKYSSKSEDKKEKVTNEEKKEILTSDPYKLLSEWLPQNIISRNYAGGLVGYLGYEAVNYFEPILKLEPHSQFPNFMFGFYTDGLIHDKYTGEIIYFYYNKNRINIVEDWIKNSTPTSIQKPKSLKIKKIFTSCKQEEHAKMVRLIKDEIILGNTFQAQLGFYEKYEVEGEQINFFEKLRLLNPSPHMFYLKFEKRLLIGSSPELLFRLQQKEIETFPLAGTIKRSSDKIEDLKLARILLNDPKEIAEHNMLVDLHRNDVGRIARFGSVRVRRLMDTKKFSHVQHISSEVVALIERSYNMFNGLASVFPAGTLTGAPKIETMKIINRVEKELGSGPRGPYGGAVGTFGLNGDCTFAIPIRSFFINDNIGYNRASGGIVYDSKEKDEYNEILNKLAAVRKALESFE